MLARNFLTADELRIPEEDRWALEQVLGMLERGEVKYHPWGNVEKIPSEMPTGDCFSMSTVGKEFECGSLHCIGGLVHRLLGRRIPPADALEKECHTDALCDLYFPRCALGKFGGITVEHAADALRNYLGCGDAKWAEVLA